MWSHLASSSDIERLGLEQQWKPSEPGSRDSRFGWPCWTLDAAHLQLQRPAFRAAHRAAGAEKFICAPTPSPRRSTRGARRSMHVSVRVRRGSLQCASPRLIGCRRSIRQSGTAMPPPLQDMARDLRWRPAIELQMQDNTYAMDQGLNSCAGIRRRALKGALLFGDRETPPRRFSTPYEIQY